MTVREDNQTNFIPRPSLCPVFDRLQCVRMEGDGLIHFNDLCLPGWTEEVRGSQPKRTSLRPFLVVSVQVLEFCEVNTLTTRYSRVRTYAQNKLFHSETLPSLYLSGYWHVVNGPGLPPPLLHAVKWSKARQWEGLGKRILWSNHG